MKDIHKSFFSVKLQVKQKDRSKRTPPNKTHKQANNNKKQKTKEANPHIIF